MTTTLKLKVKPLKQLDIFVKGKATGGLVGKYKSAFKGKGLEFEGYRKYTAADDSTLIDWKASSRTNQLLIKEFIEERNLNIYFLVDVSNSMLFGSASELKCEYAADLVSSIAYAAIRSGDSVGIALFNTGIITRIPPHTGNKQYYTLQRILTDVSLYGGGFDFVSVLKYISKYLPKGTVLIIVSDFIGLKPGWKEYLKVASKKFDVIGFMVRDIRDRELPPDGIGELMITDPYSNKQLIINPDELRQRYKSYVSSSEQDIKKTFFKARADFLELTTDQDFIKPLLSFFKGRGRRLM